MSIYSESAQARVQELRAMRQQIPNFVIPTDKTEHRKLTKAASVPQAFIELTAVAVKNSPSLVRGGATDPEQSRDLLSFADAYAPVADELEALAQFIKHSVTAARNKAGSEALTTFALAQRLAKRPENAELVPHVDDMRRALGAVKRKPKVAPVPPAPSSKPA
jgi:hypothetical protein